MRRKRKGEEKREVELFCYVRRFTSWYHISLCNTEKPVIWEGDQERTETHVLPLPVCDVSTNTGEKSLISVSSIDTLGFDVACTSLLLLDIKCVFSVLTNYGLQFSSFKC